jgi:hypothetical protein
MFNFEKEIGIEEEDKVVLPPAEQSFWLKCQWIRNQWKYGWHLSAALPFFLLSLLSFLMVVEVRYLPLYYKLNQPILPSLVVLGVLALVTGLLFR